MTSLASLSDLGVRLGLTLTADTRAQALLDDVSAEVRAETGRTFAQTTDTVTVDVCCGKARLPHGPVISITSVQVDDADVDFTWTSGRTIEIPCQVTADVVYVYGYAAVPADIIGVVCNIAGRAYGTSPQDGGRSEEHLGAFGYTIGSAAASGPFGILAGEMRVLERYKQQPAPIRMDTWA